MAKKTLVAADFTPFVWAHEGEYGGSGGGVSHQINLTGLINDDARQGEKADLDFNGPTNRFAHRYEVTLRIEFVDAPLTEGTTVDLYWAASPSGTAGTANPGNLTGADADYAGSVGSTLAQTLPQLEFLGSLICTLDNEPVVQQTTFIVELPTRFGIPVVVNNTSDIFEDDAVEMSITFTPLEDEVQ